MNKNKNAKPPQVGQSALTDWLEAACPECGGTDTEWNCSQYTNSGVETGHLRLHEVWTRFFLGCNLCSATIRVISGDKLARLMTEAANVMVWTPPLLNGIAMCQSGRVKPPLNRRRGIRYECYDNWPSSEFQ
jgi:hypothetical protein